MFELKQEINFTENHEVLVVGLFDQPVKFNNKLAKLDELFDGYLSHLVMNGDISAKRKEVSKIPTFGKIGAKRLVFVGLGKKETLTLEVVREALGKAFKLVGKAKITEAAIYLDSFVTSELNVLDIAHVTAESLHLSQYVMTTYKTNAKLPIAPMGKLVTYSELEDTVSINSALFVGDVYGRAVNSARELVNLPSNLLTATDLANYATELAAKYNFGVEILEKEDMLRLGMGALLAVNQGSKNPPKLIVLKYQGKEDWTDVIGLVGKGITFDTGGYSLKTKDGLVGMKSDMGGAAAVLGAMEVIGQTRPEQNVLMVIPSTDNMVSGDAFKPDDVITSLSGKTIEVLNTDAEGRLVLADAITYAKQLGANYLVDVATLTGGVIVALGNETTGALANNDDLWNQVLEASYEANEPMWRLPIFDRDRNRVRGSKIADLNNSPGRDGHMIMGGAFVGEFAEDTPWVHLDIAGTADTKRESDLGPSGATGVMVRTLALFVSRFQS